MSAELELVVARYAERVEWTRHVPRSVRVTVYDKGGDLDAADFPRATLVRLPNVGREAQTYLHHIVERFERPAALTVFCQGRPFDHAHDLHRVLRALAAGRETVADFRWLGFTIDTDDPRGRRLFVRWTKNEDGRELRLDEFHRLLFGEPAPERVRFYPGAQFAVTAERIRSRPRAFWEHARELAAAFPDAAHCFERLWDRLFGAVGVDEALLGGRDCVYLKPIKRVPAGGPAGDDRAPARPPPTGRSRWRRTCCR
ncbi:MAG: DUF3431 domain-containing protein [Deltaproteobacteria bacterium]|nr:DUF3431 domain-containing protein [Deltaproteobacteria bacterium]